ncbi:hypothetical protein BOTBODRAFT_167285 [Botryobasidium botryosum FD-172 SS1]|uniref:Uncharacterized protein n=1 Tax=Botryobasidium botryosum (strain FD-172 SS1) TaxID=930990 RepID=A0A067LVK8_BOTB1|nr:hypothetical protein BOTBODRAFT_167285 [Botryobasidium botryosum FD-172 SS1]
MATSIQPRITGKEADNAISATTADYTGLSFVCQQCKQPLQLDPSLAELNPSAHNMLAATLPKSANPRLASATPSQKLSHLTAPSAIQAAFQSVSSSPSSSSRPSMPSSLANRPGANKRRTASSTAGFGPSEALGTESFVMLQDSVVKKIPLSPPPGRRPQNTSLRISSKSYSGNSLAATQPPLTPTPKNTISVPPSPHAPSIPESSNNQPPSHSHNLHSNLRLFTILSSNTELDHPLCADCTLVMLGSLETKLQETRREYDGYVAFEREVKKEREAMASSGSEDDIANRIAKLKLEEEEAVETLRLAEKERAELEAELAELEREEKALEEEEAEFWKQHSENLIKAHDQEAQLSSLRSSYRTATQELTKLSRTNVYNDAFCIGVDGVFATINGLRLGRVGGVVVEWSEINAAWGQALLLLYTIARKLNYTFENYRLVPMGSFSRIERLQGDKGTYELYGSGDLHFGRLLHNRRFDYAMVFFLDCLRQIMEHVKAIDREVDFPHTIVKDKIGETSIKLGFTQEETWTRALRHVLLALKILLKWATNS